MEKEGLNKKKLIKYWIESADDDFETMLAMYQSQRYNWPLFIGHLMIEKLLKAYFVKMQEDYPPFIHNLYRLAEKTNLELSDDKKEQLITITAVQYQRKIRRLQNEFQKPMYSRFYS